jgi:NTP pyrophosphatase (non-canonical NTP hydrolase)
MTLNDYQVAARRTAIYPNKGSNLNYPALGLAGEVGEYCNKLKKVYRDDDGVLTEEKRQALIRELGDCLWYIAASASELNVVLSEVAYLNLMELRNRSEKGKLHGTGDDRGTKE